ncbi:MAG: hypothetical protein D6768_16430 [Chloroflexi bacterium]|nr:MAG: hypothetical protein D6768_16430 [Chloroflexota bacterium]
MKSKPPVNIQLTHPAVWLLALILLLVAGTGGAFAQTGGNYDLTWWTVDSGGSGGGIGSSKQVSGGSYELLSTAGQPEGPSSISGGAYTLKSGFWPGSVPNFNTYLPVVMKTILHPPDLVGSFTLSPAGPNFNAGSPVTINVVVTNQGDFPVGGFWVDFYINPSGTPTVNVRWNDLCSLNPCYGLAWYVSSLGARQSINLSSNNPAHNYSIWPGYFAGGSTTLQLYVDSWNPGVSSGSISEGDEGNNLYTYPGGIVVTGVTSSGGSAATVDLPPRPARLEE